MQVQQPSSRSAARVLYSAERGSGKGGSAMLRVMAVEGPQKGSKFEVHAGASIGRSRSCAVRLDGRHISRVHARFEPRGEALAIVDADSRNGVFVNGQKVKDQVLKKDDEIEIGEHVLIFDPSFEVEAPAGKPGDGAPAAAAGADKPTAPRPAGATAVLDSLVNPLAELSSEQLKAVLDGSRQVSAIEDDKDLGKALLDRCMAGTKAKRGFVLVGDDRGRMKPIAKIMPDDDAEFYVSNVLYHQLNRERRSIIATDVARGGPNAGKPISILGAPLLVGDGYVGFVYLDGPAEGTPPKPCFDKPQLQSIAGIAALAAPLIAAARRAARSRHSVRATLKRLDAESPIICGPGAMKDAADRIESLAPTDAAVLILGERGTGRQLVARAIHLRGPHGSHGFAVLDCGATAPAHVEAELFPAEKGTSIFDAAKGGTVYVAEIELLTADVQQKLARLLDERATHATAVQPEPRVVASSSADLEALAKEGKFSRDLLARFSATLKLPPLRARKADIPGLATHFLKAAGARPESISPDVLAFFDAHAWPGNVRELRNAIERMVIAAKGGKIDPTHIPSDLVGGDILPRVRRLVKGDLPLTTLMADLEKACLEEAMRRTGGNKAAAADLLAVSRPTLLEKLKVYGLGDEPTGPTKPPPK